MMNMEHALEEKFDVIVGAIKELNQKKDMVSEKELIPLLLETYEKILPAPAKIFVRPHQFLEACLKKKTEILKEVNKEFRLQRFSIVE